MKKIRDMLCQAYFESISHHHTYENKYTFKPKPYMLLDFFKVKLL